MYQLDLPSPLATVQAWGLPPGIIQSGHLGDQQGWWG